MIAKCHVCQVITFYLFLVMQKHYEHNIIQHLYDFFFSREIKTKHNKKIHIMHEIFFLFFICHCEQVDY